MTRQQKMLTVIVVLILATAVFLALSINSDVQHWPHPDDHY